MSLEDLFYKDPEFNSEEFIGRANLMIKKILNAITLNELDKVRHFMSDELYQKLQTEIDQNIRDGKRQIYEEINVNCQLAGGREEEESYIVNVTCLCKYIKYKISLSSGKTIEGMDDERVSVSHRIVFERKKGTVRGEVARCLGCGVTLNINDNGTCPNCGRVYDLNEFDYVIRSID